MRTWGSVMKVWHVQCVAGSGVADISYLVAANDETQIPTLIDGARFESLSISASAQEYDTDAPMIIFSFGGRRILNA